MRIEEIYDALFDEDAFRLLPARFAEYLGAKSAIINWVHRDGEAVNLAYHNFDDGLMAEYAANYVQKDAWMTEAMRPRHHNRIINASEHISAAAFERTEIYNELLRRHCDDTFYCVGGAFVNQHGLGVLGISRGRAARPFENDSLDLLEGHAVALRRVLLMRGEIAAHRRSAALASSALDVVGLAAIVVNGDLRLLHVNDAGEDMLNRRVGLMSRDGLLVALDRNRQAQLAKVIADATRSSERLTGVLAIARRDGGEPYRITVSPLPGPGRARALLLFRDPDAGQPSLAARVAQFFHLTPTEAQLAVALSEGATVEEMVARRGSRESTIRTQIKALAAKMECRRQVEIAALVARLPPLREP